MNWIITIEISFRTKVMGFKNLILAKSSKGVRKVVALTIQ